MAKGRVASCLLFHAHSLEIAGRIVLIRKYIFLSFFIFLAKLRIVVIPLLQCTL